MSYIIRWLKTSCQAYMNAAASIMPTACQSGLPRAPKVNSAIAIMANPTRAAVKRAARCPASRIGKVTMMSYVMFVNRPGEASIRARLP